MWLIQSSEFRVEFVRLSVDCKQLLRPAPESNAITRTKPKYCTKIGTYRLDTLHEHGPRESLDRVPV